eukprot:241975-Chlamydomonas_euryale.AAC.4
MLDTTLPTPLPTPLSHLPLPPLPCQGVDVELIDRCMAGLTRGHAGALARGRATAKAVRTNMLLRIRHVKDVQDRHGGGGSGGIWGSDTWGGSVGGAGGGDGLGDTWGDGSGGAGGGSGQGTPLPRPQATKDRAANGSGR